MYYLIQEKIIKGSKFMVFLTSMFLAGAIAGGGGSDTIFPQEQVLVASIPYDLVVGDITLDIQENISAFDENLGVFLDQVKFVSDPIERTGSQTVVSTNCDMDFFRARPVLIGNMTVPGTDIEHPLTFSYTNSDWDIPGCIEMIKGLVEDVHYTLTWDCVDSSYISMAGTGTGNEDWVLDGQLTSQFLINPSGGCVIAVHDLELQQTGSLDVYYVYVPSDLDQDGSTGFADLLFLIQTWGHEDWQGRELDMVLNIVNNWD